MNAAKLREVLENHRKWIAGEGGERANLSGADLYGANLSRANLSGAELSGANLSGANLYGANLSRADLSGANLFGANLSRANLSGANLSGVNLSGANLSRANLSRANLSRANLSGANLSGTDLSWANLSGATLDTGETWEEYLSDVVPSILCAGGKTISEVATAEHWDCHNWNDCPMAAAFGVKGESEAPLLLRPRIRQFVQLFDAKLIPMPRVS